VNKTPDWQVNNAKVYVGVNVDYKSDGAMVPRSIVLGDDKNYTIDKVLDIRPAASLKAGGAGMRYTVRIKDKLVYMFLEDDHGVGRWFMERG